MSDPTLEHPVHGVSNHLAQLGWEDPAGRYRWHRSVERTRRSSILTRGLAALALCAAFVGTAIAQQPAVATPQTDEEFDLEKEMESFDVVWTTVRDRHWDPELGGIDWEQAKVELRPRMQEATTRAEARKILNELLGRLGQSHYGIVPEKAYASLESNTNPTRLGDLGLQCRWIEDAIVVTQVRPGSPAAEAKVEPGWTLQQLGKVSSAKIIEDARTAGHEGPTRLETLVGLICDKVQQGPIGSEVSLTLGDHEDKLVELQLTRAQTPGKQATFGNMPPMRLRVETEMLAGDVSYIQLNMFFDPVTVMPKFAEAVEAARAGRGLVIDLRGNIGGLGAMTFGMGGWFVKEQSFLGVMKTRDSQLKFTLLPRPEPYQGLVAILIDECSISSAEIMAGGLKDQKIARVFGQRSAGLALPSTVVRLPNGDGFQYAIASYESASGQPLEGLGVEPDEPVALSRSQLREQPDPVLAAALRWITQQSAVPE